VTEYSDTTAQEIYGVPFYWICCDCALVRGWTPRDTIETLHEDTCPYCGEVKVVGPVRGYERGSR
jgi:rubrerythrin